MTTTVTLPPEGVWSRFCNWIISTENHLYMGGFAVLMMLLFQYVSLNNAPSWHFVLATDPVVGIGFAVLGLNTIGFKLNGFHFKGSGDNRGRVIDTWDDEPY